MVTTATIHVKQPRDPEKKYSTTATWVNKGKMAKGSNSEWRGGGGEGGEVEM